MKYFKLLALSSVVIGLLGCSAEEQDSAATNEKQPVSVSGVVIDPNISSSIVFADYDEDGVLDSFEPWVLTDQSGYFGVSEEGVDYCATDSDHCLVLANDNPVPLVAVGGYDTVTLERVNTRLSRTFNGDGLQVISPLTSLKSMVVSESFDQNINFMAEAFVEEKSTTALQMAFHLNKMVEVLSEVLIAEYPAIGEEELLPSDLSGFVFKAIDTVGSDQELMLNLFLIKYSENQIELILDQARALINQAYSDAGISLIPQNYQAKDSRSYVTSTSNVVTAQELSDLLAGISRHVEESFGLALANEGIAELPKIQKGLLRQIQLTVNTAVKAIEEKRDVLASTLPLVYMLIATDDNLLMTNFGQDSYDSSFFDNQLIADTDTLNELLSTMDNRQMMPRFVGSKMLALSEINSQEQAKVTFYFDGELSGSLKACVYYQDLTDSTNINNTQGTLLEGQWDKDDYQLFVKVIFAGSPRSLRIKSGTGTSFVFDYDGKDKSWDGSKSFEPISGDVPTTDLACQTSFL